MSDRRNEPPGDDDTPPRGTPKPFAQADSTLAPRPSSRRGATTSRIPVETELEPLDDDNGDDDEDWDDEPNYLIRRLFLIVLVLVGLVAAFVVVTQVLGGDDSGSSGDGDARWDTVLVLTDDEILLLERDGLDEVDSIAVASGLLDAQAIVAGDTLVTMTDQGRITMLDLIDGTERRGRAGLDETLRPSSDNPAIALVSSDGGGDVTIVDTIRSSVLSIGDTAGLDAPLIFSSNVRVNEAGTHVAAPVPSAFQSVVVDLVDETSRAYAGRIIAIDDTRVVTEQPAGADSEIEFHQLGGERLGTVDVPSPAATLLAPGGSLLLVDGDGSVRTATDDGETSDGDPVVDDGADPVTVSDGVAAYGNRRLLLDTSAGTVLLDADGTQLAVVDGRSALTPTRGTRCIVVSSGSSSRPSTVLDLESGEVILEIDRGVVTTSSSDGCTAAVTGGPSPRLLADGELVDVDADSIEAIAPDGAAYVVLDGRDTEYVRVGEDDPVEITDEPSFVRFGLRR